MRDWQTMRAKPWLRTVAFLTAFVFTATTVAWADGIHLADSFSKENKFLQPDVKATQGASLNLIDSIVLPDTMGQIKNTFQGSRDKVIIHIQDAHINEEAQRNIALILDHFASQYQLNLINVEGAEGRLYPEVFSYFPNQEARREVADYFLKEGRLSGPEYLAIVDRPGVELYGIEDGPLYDTNRKAYLDAMHFKGRDEAILADLEKVLKDLSRFVFSKELRGLVRRRAAFQEGGKELVDYVRFLSSTARKQEINLAGYSGMNSLTQLVELESEIDFVKAEKEIELLTSDLKRIISKERLTRFLTNTVQFRMKKMRRSEYYGYLEEEIENSSDEVLREKYANVLKYLSYMQLYDAIGIEIFDEIEVLENAIKSAMFRSQEERDLDRLHQIYEVYEKIFSFTLTKQDADFFYKNREAFKSATFSDLLTPLLKKHRFAYELPENISVLDEDLLKVEQFYAAALSRDRVLIEKSIHRMKERKQSISAVITGGFHTPGIEKYLRDHDYSYMVITPRISKAIDAEKEGALYDAALHGRPLDVEKLLSEAFLPPKQTQLNDPRFQLSVEKMAPDQSTLLGFNRFVAELPADQPLLYSLGAAQGTRYDSIAPYQILSIRASAQRAESAPLAVQAAMSSMDSSLAPEFQAPFKRILSRFEGSHMERSARGTDILYLQPATMNQKLRVPVIAAFNPRNRSEVRAELGARQFFSAELTPTRSITGRFLDRDYLSFGVTRALKKNAEARTEARSTSSDIEDEQVSDAEKITLFWAIMESAAEQEGWNELTARQKWAVWEHYLAALDLKDVAFDQILADEPEGLGFDYPDLEMRERAYLNTAAMRFILQGDIDYVGFQGSLNQVENLWLRFLEAKIELHDADAAMRLGQLEVIGEELRGLLDDYLDSPENEAALAQVQRILENIQKIENAHYAATWTSGGIRFDVLPEFRGDHQDMRRDRLLLDLATQNQEVNAAMRQAISGAGLRLEEAVVSVKVIRESSEEAGAKVRYNLSIASPEGIWAFYLLDDPQSGRVSFSSVKPASVLRRSLLYTAFARGRDSEGKQLPRAPINIHRKISEISNEENGVYGFEIENAEDPTSAKQRLVIRKQSDESALAEDQKTYTFQYKGDTYIALYPFIEIPTAEEGVVASSKSESRGGPETLGDFADELSKKGNELKSLASDVKKESVFQRANDLMLTFLEAIEPSLDAYREVLEEVHEKSAAEVLEREKHRAAAQLQFDAVRKQALSAMIQALGELEFPMDEETAAIIESFLKKSKGGLFNRVDPFPKEFLDSLDEGSLKAFLLKYQEVIYTKLPPDGSYPEPEDLLLALKESDAIMDRFQYLRMLQDKIERVLAGEKVTQDSISAINEIQERYDEEVESADDILETFGDTEQSQIDAFETFKFEEKRAILSEIHNLLRDIRTTYMIYEGIQEDQGAAFPQKGEENMQVLQERHDALFALYTRMVNSISGHYAVVTEQFHEDALRKQDSFSREHEKLVNLQRALWQAEDDGKRDSVIAQALLAVEEQKEVLNRERAARGKTLSNVIVFSGRLRSNNRQAEVAGDVPISRSELRTRTEKLEVESTFYSLLHHWSRAVEGLSPLHREYVERGLARRGFMPEFFEDEDEEVKDRRFRLWSAYEEYKRTEKVVADSSPSKKEDREAALKQQKEARRRVEVLLIEFGLVDSLIETREEKLSEPESAVEAELVEGLTKLERVERSMIETLRAALEEDLQQKLDEADARVGHVKRLYQEFYNEGRGVLFGGFGLKTTAWFLFFNALLLASFAFLGFGFITLFQPSQSTIGLTSILFGLVGASLTFIVISISGQNPYRTILNYAQERIEGLAELREKQDELNGLVVEIQAAYDKYRIRMDEWEADLTTGPSYATALSTFKSKVSDVQKLDGKFSGLFRFIVGIGQSVSNSKAWVTGLWQRTTLVLKTDPSWVIWQIFVAFIATSALSYWFGFGIGALIYVVAFLMHTVAKRYLDYKTQLHPLLTGFSVAVVGGLLVYSLFSVINEKLSGSKGEGPRQERVSTKDGTSKLTPAQEQVIINRVKRGLDGLDPEKATKKDIDLIMKSADRLPADIRKALEAEAKRKLELIERALAERKKGRPGNQGDKTERVDDKRPGDKALVLKDDEEVRKALGSSGLVKGLDRTTDAPEDYLIQHAGRTVFSKEELEAIRLLLHEIGFKFKLNPKYDAKKNPNVFRYIPDYSDKKTQKLALKLLGDPKQGQMFSFEDFAQKLFYPLFKDYDLIHDAEYYKRFIPKKATAKQATAAMQKKYDSDRQRRVTLLKRWTYFTKKRKAQLKGRTATEKATEDTWRNLMSHYFNPLDAPLVDGAWAALGQRHKKLHVLTLLGLGWRDVLVYERNKAVKKEEAELQATLTRVIQNPAFRAQFVNAAAIGNPGVTLDQLVADKRFNAFIRKSLAVIADARVTQADFDLRLYKALYPYGLRIPRKDDGKVDWVKAKLGLGLRQSTADAKNGRILEHATDLVVDGIYPFPLRERADLILLGKSILAERDQRALNKKQVVALVKWMAGIYGNYKTSRANSLQELLQQRLQRIAQLGLDKLDQENGGQAVRSEFELLWNKVYSLGEELEKNREDQRNRTAEIEAVKGILKREWKALYDSLPEEKREKLQPLTSGLLARNASSILKLKHTILVSANVTTAQLVKHFISFYHPDVQDGWRRTHVELSDFTGNSVEVRRLKGNLAVNTKVPYFDLLVRGEGTNFFGINKDRQTTDHKREADKLIQYLEDHVEEMPDDFQPTLFAYLYLYKEAKDNKGWARYKARRLRALLVPVVGYAQAGRLIHQLVNETQATRVARMQAKIIRLAETMFLNIQRNEIVARQQHAYGRSEFYTMKELKRLGYTRGIKVEVRFGRPFGKEVWFKDGNVVSDEEVQKVTAPILKKYLASSIEHEQQKVIAAGYAQKDPDTNESVSNRDLIDQLYNRPGKGAQARLNLSFYEDSARVDSLIGSFVSRGIAPENIWTTLKTAVKIRKMKALDPEIVKIFKKQPYDHAEAMKALAKIPPKDRKKNVVMLWNMILDQGKGNFEGKWLLEPRSLRQILKEDFKWKGVNKPPPIHVAAAKKIQIAEILKSQRQIGSLVSTAELVARMGQENVDEILTAAIDFQIKYPQSFELARKNARDYVNKMREVFGLETPQLPKDVGYFEGDADFQGVLGGLLVSRALKTEKSRIIFNNEMEHLHFLRRVLEDYQKAIKDRSPAEKFLYHINFTDHFTGKQARRRGIAEAPHAAEWLMAALAPKHAKARVSRELLQKAFFYYWIDRAPWKVEAGNPGSGFANWKEGDIIPSNEQAILKRVLSKDDRKWNEGLIEPRERRDYYRLYLFHGDLKDLSDRDNPAENVARYARDLQRLLDKGTDTEAIAKKRKQLRAARQRLYFNIQFRDFTNRLKNNNEYRVLYLRAFLDEFRKDAASFPGAFDNPTPLKKEDDVRFEDGDVKHVDPDVNWLKALVGGDRANLEGEGSWGDLLAAHLESLEGQALSGDDDLTQVAFRDDFASPDLDADLASSLGVELNDAEPQSSTTEVEGTKKAEEAEEEVRIEVSEEVEKLGEELRFLENSVLEVVRKKIEFYTGDEKMFLSEELLEERNKFMESSSVREALREDLVVTEAQGPVRFVEDRHYGSMPAKRFLVQGSGEVEVQVPIAHARASGFPLVSEIVGESVDTAATEDELDEYPEDLAEEDPLKFTQLALEHERSEAIKEILQIEAEFAEEEKEIRGSDREPEEMAAALELLALQKEVQLEGPQYTIDVTTSDLRDLKLYEGMTGAATLLRSEARKADPLTVFEAELEAGIASQLASGSKKKLRKNILNWFRQEIERQTLGEFEEAGGMEKLETYEALLKKLPVYKPKDKDKHLFFTNPEEFLIRDLQKKEQFLEKELRKARSGQSSLNEDAIVDVLLQVNALRDQIRQERRDAKRERKKQRKEAEERLRQELFIDEEPKPEAEAAVEESEPEVKKETPESKKRGFLVMLTAALVWLASIFGLDMLFSGSNSSRGAEPPIGFVIDKDVKQAESTSFNDKLDSFKAFVAHFPKKYRATNKGFKKYVADIDKGVAQVSAWHKAWVEGLTIAGFDYTLPQSAGPGSGLDELILRLGKKAMKFGTEKEQRAAGTRIIALEAEKLWADFDAAVNAKHEKINPDIREIGDSAILGRYMSFAQQWALEGDTWITKVSKMRALLRDKQKVDQVLKSDADDGLARPFYRALLQDPKKLTDPMTRKTVQSPKMQAYFMAYFAGAAGQPGSPEEAWKKWTGYTEKLRSFLVNRNGRESQELFQDAFVLQRAKAGKSYDLNDDDVAQEFERFKKEFVSSPDNQGALISWGITRISEGWVKTRGLALKMAQVISIPGFVEAVVGGGEDAIDKVKDIAGDPHVVKGKNDNEVEFQFDDEVLQKGFASVFFGRKASIYNSGDLGVLFGLAQGIAKQYPRQNEENYTDEEKKDIVKRIAEMAHMTSDFMGWSEGTPLRDSKIGVIYRRIFGEDFSFDNPYAVAWLSGELNYRVGLSGQEQSDFGDRSRWMEENNLERRKAYWRQQITEPFNKRVPGNLPRHALLFAAGDPNVQIEARDLLRLISRNPKRKLDLKGNKVDFGYLVNWAEQKMKAGLDTPEAKGLILRMQFLIKSEVFQTYLKELGFSSDLRKDLAEGFAAVEKKAEGKEKLTQEDLSNIQKFYQLMGQLSFFSNYSIEEIRKRLDKALKAIDILRKHYAPKVDDPELAKEKMLDGIQEIFSRLTFDHPIGSKNWREGTEGMTAKNYSQLRQMMYLLAEIPKFRDLHNVHGLALLDPDSDEPKVNPKLPKKVHDDFEAFLISAKRRFKAVFTESFLPSFLQMVNRHTGEGGSVKSVEELILNFEKIIDAFQGYPIHLEGTDPISSRYQFGRFIRRLGAEGIRFDLGLNRSLEIYTEIFHQDQIMGQVSWNLDQMLPTAEEPLKIEDVVGPNGRIKRKKMLWEFYQKYWNTNYHVRVGTDRVYGLDEKVPAGVNTEKVHMQIPVTASEISFLEKMGLSQKEYELFFQQAITLQGWARHHLKRELYFDEIVYWIFSSGQWWDDHVMPIRAFGRLFNVDIAAWRMHMTFRNVLPKDAKTRIYNLALSTPFKEKTRFILWHGQRQLMRILNAKERAEWLDVQSRLEVVPTAIPRHLLVPLDEVGLTPAEEEEKDLEQFVKTFLSNYNARTGKQLRLPQGQELDYWISGVSAQLAIRHEAYRKLDEDVLAGQAIPARDRWLKQVIKNILTQSASDAEAGFKNTLFMGRIVSKAVRNYNGLEFNPDTMFANAERRAKYIRFRLFSKPHAMVLTKRQDNMSPEELVSHLRGSIKSRTLIKLELPSKPAEWVSGLRERLKREKPGFAKLSAKHQEKQLKQVIKAILLHTGNLVEEVEREFVDKKGTPGLNLKQTLEIVTDEVIGGEVQQLMKVEQEISIYYATRFAGYQDPDEVVSRAERYMDPDDLITEWINMYGLKGTVIDEKRHIWEQLIKQEGTISRDDVKVVFHDLKKIREIWLEEKPDEKRFRKGGEGEAPGEDAKLEKALLLVSNLRRLGLPEYGLVPDRAIPEFERTKTYEDTKKKVNEATGADLRTNAEQWVGREKLKEDYPGMSEEEAQSRVEEDGADEEESRTNFFINLILMIGSGLAWLWTLRHHITAFRQRGDREDTIRYRGDPVRSEKMAIPRGLFGITGLVPGPELMQSFVGFVLMLTSLGMMTFGVYLMLNGKELFGVLFIAGGPLFTMLFAWGLYDSFSEYGVFIGSTVMSLAGLYLVGTGSMLSGSILIFSGLFTAVIYYLFARILPDYVQEPGERITEGLLSVNRKNVLYFVFVLSFPVLMGLAYLKSHTMATSVTEFVVPMFFGFTWLGLTTGHIIFDRIISLFLKANRERKEIDQFYEPKVTPGEHAEIGEAHVDNKEILEVLINIKYEQVDDAKSESRISSDLVDKEVRALNSALDRLSTDISTLKSRRRALADPEHPEWRQIGRILKVKRALRDELLKQKGSTGTKKSKSQLNRERARLEFLFQQNREEEHKRLFYAMTEEEKRTQGVPEGFQMPIMIITMHNQVGPFTDVVKNLTKSMEANPGENIPGYIHHTGDINTKTTVDLALVMHDQYQQAIDDGKIQRFYYSRRARPFSSGGINEGKKPDALNENFRWIGDGAFVPEITAEKATSRDMPFYSFRTPAIRGFLLGLLWFIVGGSVGVSTALALKVFFGIIFFMVGITNVSLYVFSRAGSTTRELNQKGSPVEDIDRTKTMGLISPEVKGSIASTEFFYGDLAEWGYESKDPRNRGLTQGGPKFYVSNHAFDEYHEYFMSLNKGGRVVYQYDEARNIGRYLHDGKWIEIIYDYDQNPSDEGRPRIALNKKSPKRVWGVYLLDDKNEVGLEEEKAIRWYARKFDLPEETTEDVEEVKEMIVDFILDVRNAYRYDSSLSKRENRRRRGVIREQMFADFEGLMEGSNPAFHSVRKAAIEMIENPRAALGQPIYGISGAYETMFTRMNAEAAVIGAFYAEAALFFTQARANFTGKGPLILERWLYGVRELQEKIPNAFFKGGTFGIIFGAILGAFFSFLIGGGFIALMGYFMLAGFLLGATILGNRELRHFGGAFAAGYKNELSHDYYEGGHSGALTLLLSFVLEGSVKNLKDEIARSVTRWFQGVIPYPRHQLGPGVTLGDRWHMLLAEKMYINDIILLGWMLGGLLSLTISGLADRIYAVTRIQEFNSYMTLGKVLPGSPVFWAFLVALFLVGILLIVSYIGRPKTAKGFTLGLNRVLQLAFNGALVFFLTLGWLHLPISAALFGFAVPLMIYFGIFTGAQLGDNAGFANIHQRVMLLFLSSMIALNRPWLTVKHATENYLRVVSSGTQPRSPSHEDTYKVGGKEIGYIVIYWLAVSLLLITLSGIVMMTMGLGPQNQIAQLLVMAFLVMFIAPVIASRLVNRYLTQAWANVGLSTIVFVGFVALLLYPPVLPAVTQWTMSTLSLNMPILQWPIERIYGFLASGTAAASAVGLMLIGFSILVKALATVWVLERGKKNVEMEKDPLPWRSFGLVATASSTLALYDAGKMTYMNFVFSFLTVISGVFFMSHHWGFVWGFPFLASWALGWLHVWYTSKPLKWDPSEEYSDYVAWMRLNKKDADIEKLEERVDDENNWRSGEDRETAYIRMVREDYMKSDILPLDTWSLFRFDKAWTLKATNWARSAVLGVGATSVLATLIFLIWPGALSSIAVWITLTVVSIGLTVLFRKTVATYRFSLSGMTRAVLLAAATFGVIAIFSLLSPNLMESVLTLRALVITTLAIFLSGGLLQGPVRISISPRLFLGYSLFFLLGSTIVVGVLIATGTFTWPLFMAVTIGSVVGGFVMSLLTATLSRIGAPSILLSLWDLVRTDWKDFFGIRFANQKKGTPPIKKGSPDRAFHAGAAMKAVWMNRVRNKILKLMKPYATALALAKSQKEDYDLKKPLPAKVLAELNDPLITEAIKVTKAIKGINEVKTVGDLLNLENAAFDIGGDVKGLDGQALKVGSSELEVQSYLTATLSSFIQNTAFTIGAFIGWILFAAVIVGTLVYLFGIVDNFVILSSGDSPLAKALYLVSVTFVAAMVIPGLVANTFAKFFRLLAYYPRIAKAVLEFFEKFGKFDDIEIIPLVEGLKMKQKEVDAEEDAEDKIIPLWQRLGIKRMSMVWVVSVVLGGAVAVATMIILIGILNLGITWLSILAISFVALNILTPLYVYYMASKRIDEEFARRAEVEAKKAAAASPPAPGTAPAAASSESRLPARTEARASEFSESLKAALQTPVESRLAVLLRELTPEQKERIHERMMQGLEVPAELASQLQGRRRIFIQYRSELHGSIDYIEAVLKNAPDGAQVEVYAENREDALAIAVKYGSRIKMPKSLTVSLRRAMKELGVGYESVLQAVAGYGLEPEDIPSAQLAGLTLVKQLADDTILTLGVEEDHARLGGQYVYLADKLEEYLYEVGFEVSA